MLAPGDQDATEVLSELYAQLGEKLLASLLRVSAPELRAHVDEGKPPLADVAARAAFLVQLLQHLSGTYNTFGIQRWFRRKRAQLDGCSPLEHLLSKPDWKPDNKAAIEVAELARSSNYFIAT